MSCHANQILAVNFFLASSGSEPVRDWLREMDREHRKVISEDIKLVQFRWPLGMPLVRKMEPDLWEIWSILADGNAARVFFTVKGDQMILLHGIIKKSPKTPRQALELARARKNQWLKEA